MNRFRGVVIAALALLLMAAAPALAQITTGTVSGTVRDAQGGVVPGATVVLTNDARGTKTSPAVTNATGDFVVPNLTAGTYTMEVTMPSFKTLKRSNVVVSPGSRVSIEGLVLEVGGASEIVDVKGEAPLVQANTGERSFTITTDSVDNLPIANRSFTALTSLTPGVSGNNRIGGGGGNNIMIDGVSAVDTGSNSILLQMNVESIAEVKVLTSGYQAEYGRSSGLQVTAVTKSGTNRFRGSVYDVERNSDWNSNSHTNILNGDPKTVLRERDFGYSIGGPIGKPGGNNKLFFFYSHEYAPRTAGNDVRNFRVPTALERQGDFSQTTDNNGNLYTLIKDPLSTAACTASNNAGCFQDGGVVGKIPANRLYQPGLNILKLYPLPNLTSAPGQAFNYQVTRPEEKALAWQPAIRVDFQPTQGLRVTYKYSGWKQTTKQFNGTLPGIDDSAQYRPIVSTTAYTANYTLTPTMFLEATYGHSQNELAGCGLAQAGTGPTFCTSGIGNSAAADRQQAGLIGLPMIFPDALKLNPDYYAYKVLSDMQPSYFQNGQILRTPNFTWGGRVANAPPNIPFAGFLNINSTHDISISLTKVQGPHTFKGGFYNTHSYKAQQQNSGATFGTYNFQNVNTNPLDTTFPFANAAVGVVNSLNQLSTYIEGSYVYNNTEGYIQDNWKLTSRMTLDYGVRFVHQQPQYDELGQASNFFVDQYNVNQAPALYGAGCVGASPCSGNNRQAKNPQTGALLGNGSAVLIGTLVPNTGNATNGIKQSGDGITKTTYTWPAVGYAPRFGGAYDLRGNQSVVIRGGIGIYFDRPSGNSIYAQVTNPPAVKNVTVNNADLSNLGAGAQGPPALSVFEYAGGLPTSNQWNAGVQMTLPWSTAVDVSYVGQHAWNQYTGTNINAVDFGTTFLAQNQDPTQPSTFFGSNTVATDQMRAVRGYGGITQQLSRGWSTYHSLQVSFQRRFKDGLSFGFNDTISLSSTSQSGARIEHNADGTWQYRADQKQADDLLQQDPVFHNFKGNFVWDMPDLKSDKGGWKAVGYVINDWQLSGIWTASTASPYTVNFAYQNGGGSVNLTGSPDYGARVRIAGDPGAGCSGDVYRQFNTSAFQGPPVGSVGLDSGANYLKGCFQSVLDLSIARNIRLPKGRTIQLRADMFNAPNQSNITGRNTTMNLNSPSDPVTITNLPYDASGNLIATRSLPRGAASASPIRIRTRGPCRCRFASPSRAPFPTHHGPDRNIGSARVLCTTAL